MKPIPVRPISSSASSTHSSSGVAVAVAAAASAAAASATNHGVHSLLSKSEPAPADQSFSLIAKYFASFPATRLKASHLEPVSNSCFVAPTTTTLFSASSAADGNQLSNPATPVATLTSLPASTPHYALPPAHFAAANSATTPVNVTPTMATTTGNHLFENSASKHQPTTRFLPFKQVKKRAFYVD